MAHDRLLQLISQKPIAALVVLTTLALPPAPSLGRETRLPNHALEAWDEAKGLAVAPAFAWAKAQHMTCDMVGGGVEPCTVASRTESVQVHIPNPDLAVVAIYYNPSTGNHSGTFAALLMGRKKNGDYRIMREMTNIPNAITKVIYEGSRLVIDVEVRKEGDLGCCPTGVGRYAYDLSSGAVTYLWGDRPMQ